MPQTADPEVLKRIIEGQVKRCKDELTQAEHFARTGDIEAMRRRFERLRTVIKGSRLPPDILNDVKEQTRKIEVDGLKKAIDLWLGKAIDCAHVDDVAGRQNALKPVREHLGRAVALGAGDDFKTVTEKKIEVIMQTDSSKAVAKKGQESNRLSAVKRPEFEAVHQNERRRYKRFRLPALLVTVAGRTYSSNSWSIGGGALPGWEGSDSGRFEVRLKAEGNDAAFSDSIELVRLDGTTACFKFLNPTQSTLKLVQLLSNQGQAPKE
jgi:CRISPR/Cas system CMR-associated protein Cmr5 small subunit